MDNEYLIIVDTPEPGVLTVELSANGAPIDLIRTPYQGPVDNLLLTTIDNLLMKHRIHKFALKAVQLGQGIDKNSSLYRMVQSFATAIAAAHQRP